MSRAWSGSPEKQQRILQAAQDLFLELGYQGTTLAMVSARSGLAIGSITHLVGEKPGIACEVHRRLTDELTLLIGTAAQALSKEYHGATIRRIIEAALAWFESHPGYWALIEALEIHPLTQAHHEYRAAQRLADVLEREPSLSGPSTGERADGPRLFALILAPILTEARLLNQNGRSSCHRRESAVTNLTAAAVAGLAVRSLVPPKGRRDQKLPAQENSRRDLFSAGGAG